MENVSVVNVVFWNRGHVTIDGRSHEKGGDIRKPISISVGEGKIYSAEVIEKSETDKDNKFDVTINEKGEAVVNFECLEHKHGAVVQIVTDCDDENKIELKGKIKTIEKEIKTSKKNRKKTQDMLDFITAITMLLLIVFAIYMCYHTAITDPDYFIMSFITTIGVILFCGSLSLIILTRGIFLHNLPKKFHKFVSTKRPFW